jgi:hypothetical protein
VNKPDSFANIDTVNASLNLLFRSLGTDKVAEFRQEYLPTWKDIGYKEDPIIYAQRISKDFLSHYGVIVTRAIVAFRSDLEVPGVVELSNQNDLFVEVDSIYQGERDAILAILAHEMTHIFLHKVGLNSKNEQQNEILTDVTAMFLGFGLLLLNSNGIIVWKVGKQMHFGYLSLDEQGYLLAKRCAYFGLNFKGHLRKGLPKESFNNGKNRLKEEMALLFPNKGTTRSGKPLALGFAETSEEIKCIMCSQRLRLPPGKAKGVATCPTCKTDMKRP